MTNFFGPFSPYLNHPLLTKERTSAEVDQLLRILGLGAGQMLLDVGCGFGRHSLELARRGVRPTGLDPSETMIAAARTVADNEQLSATFTVGSAESVTSGPFDGAIAMFTTLGQVGPDGNDNHGLLAATAQTLAPGAGLVVEVPQRGPAVAGLVTEDRFGDGDNRTEISRRFDKNTARVIERFNVVADGVEREFDLAYRLFSAEELAARLNDAGLTNVRLGAQLADLAPVSALAANPDPDPDTGTGIGTAVLLDPEAPTMYASAVVPH